METAEDAHAAGAALRAHRGSIGVWTLGATVARLVPLGLGVLVSAPGDRFDDGDVAGLAGTGVLTLSLLAWAAVPLLRVRRSRPVDLAEPRRFRPHPGPASLLAAIWWAPLLLAVAWSSRSENEPGTGVEWLDALLVAGFAVALVTWRRDQTLELSAEAVRYRGRPWFVDAHAAVEDAVVPLSVERRFYAVIGLLVVTALALMAFTFAAYWALVPALVLCVIARRAFAGRRIEIAANWRDVDLVALDGGRGAALAFAGGQLLRLDHFLRSTDRNEPLVWTALAQDVRAGGRATTLVAELHELAARPRPRPAPSGATVHLRPRLETLRAYRRRVVAGGGLIGVVVLAVLVLVRLTRGGIGAVLPIAAGVALAVLALAGAVVHLMTLRIEAGPFGVRHRSLLRRRSWRPDELDKLLTVTVTGKSTGAPPRDTYLVGAGGRHLVRLPEAAWSEADLERLAAAAGIPRVDSGLAVPARVLAEAVPGSMSSWRADPGRTGLASSAVILGVAVAIGVVIAPDSPDAGGDGERSENLRAERALKHRVDSLISVTFPVARDEGGDPRGCVRATASGEPDLSGCALSRRLRRRILRAAGGDRRAAVRALCRCVPGDHPFSTLTELTLPPDAVEEAGETDPIDAAIPKPGDPVLIARARMIGAVMSRLELTVVRRPGGRYRIRSIACADEAPAEEAGDLGSPCRVP